MTWDAAVIGLGVMGSAALYRLAKRGLHVVGLDRFHLPHDRGSSHGRTRVIRQAYYEHPDYVPLVLRAYELWRELEADSGTRLLETTGAYMIGTEESRIVRGSLESARRHGLAHRFLSAAELRSAVPALRPPPDQVALHEREAGVLLAEECVQAFLDRARALDAEIRFGVRATIGDPSANRTIVTTGPWMPELAPFLPLQVERQVSFWFDRVPGVPLFLWDDGDRPFYGLPDLRGDGVKIAFHHGGESADPEGVDREVADRERVEMEQWVAERIPGLGRSRGSKVCLYTNTPDSHFRIGAMPGDPSVVYASACSGHGFKFAPVVGEILADLAIEGRTRHSLELFAPRADGPGAPSGR